MKSFFIFLFSVFAFSGVIAQRGFSETPVKFEGYDVRFFPFIKGKYEAHLNDFYNPFSLAYDKKQENLLEGNVKKIISAFNKYEPLNPPQGLDAKLFAYVSANEFPPVSKTRLTGIIEMFIMCYQEDQEGKPVTRGETSSVLALYINNPSLLVGSPILDDIYPCPAKTGDFYSYPINETGRGEATILTNIKRPLYLPVSREEFINQTITYLQKKINEANGELKEKDSGLSPRQAFEEGKKQRFKDYKIAYGKLMKLDPTQAEEYKKSFEQMERDLEEEINKSDDYSVSKKDLVGKSNSFLEQKISELRSELKALSAEERKQQAYYSVSGLELSPSGLVPADYEGADALVRVNPNLLDSKRPQSDIQLIIVSWQSLKPRTYDGGKDAFNIENSFFAELSKDESLWKSIISTLTK